MIDDIDNYQPLDKSSKYSSLRDTTTLCEDLKALPELGEAACRTSRSSEVRDDINKSCNLLAEAVERPASTNRVRQQLMS